MPESKAVKMGLLMLLLMLQHCVAAKPKLRGGLESSPLTEVEALDSGRVLLPCLVSPPVSSDDTILVLFYRSALRTPIYSIDGRNGPVRRVQHWYNEQTLGTRAYFDLSSSPPGLVLSPVTSSDQDEYRCRVDFRSAPTRYVRVNLRVIVPPKRIRVLSESEVEVSGVIGPYPVGASLVLHCRVDGGRPAPHVTWWNEETLLDDVIEEQGAQVTVNTLTLPALTRSDLYLVLTCKSSNSNLSVPLAAAVTIDMSFPPLDVRILGSKEAPLSEGRQYKIVCESSGSRPSATITWWKDGMLMTDARTKVFQEGNVSRSTLHLTPSLADDDAYISCRAKNPLVPTAVMEDATKLNVYYAPRLSLAAGTTLDMEDIKEGDDVYFECGIKANPSIYKVQWFHNGEELVHNVSAGVIQSNQSLVLQGLTKTFSGQYTCSASNPQGTCSSNAVQLSVKFSPLCRPGQTTVYGAGKMEELNITCSVEAHPEPISFRWAFNSSSEVVDIPVGRVRAFGKGRSQVSYTPRRHQDYGSLLCWATNDVGVQRRPCVYHVIHAATPDPVNNCTVENISSTGAGVRCEAGWDGGLAQTFTLSVSHAHAHAHTRGGQEQGKAAPRVLANTSTAPKPHFSLSGLEPGTEYVLTVSGVNKKGQSAPVRLAVFTLRDVAEKRTSAGDGGGGLAVTWVLAAVVGAFVSLALTSALVVALLRRRRRGKRGKEGGRRRRGASHRLPVERKEGLKMAYGRNDDDDDDADDDANAADDHNPDVIPVNDDHQVQAPQQQQQKQQLLGTVGIGAGPEMQLPRQLELYGGQMQHHLSKEFLQASEGSFYINPGTLLPQMTASRDPHQEPLSLVGGPLAASTPTAAASPPTLYAQQHLPYVPFPSAYVQDLRPIACPPPYPDYALGRKLGPSGAPSFEGPQPFPLALTPEREPLGLALPGPWEEGSERSVSPSHRESSV